jgi:lipoate-protein ligase A
MWAETLSQLGAHDVAVHGGGGQHRGWDAWVCFAGVGPGEVTSRGRKVVGISQWRTRQGALFHVAAYRHWDPAQLVAILRDPRSGSAAPPGTFDTVAVGVGELITERSARASSEGSSPDQVGFDAGTAVIDALVARLTDSAWEVRTDRS